MTGAESSQRTPQSAELEFDSKHIEPILSGEKTVTLRVGLDASDYPVGSPLAFVDEGGDLFAEAEVVDRGYTTVEMAAKMQFDGHRDYESADELIEELSEYYPDEEIGPATKIEIVEWGDLW